MSHVLGIIGHPVAHSLSPIFQGAALRHLAIDATYDAWETPPESLPARIDELRGPGLLGANVTIPHKQAVMPLLDYLDHQAELIGAVNTIVNDNGRLGGFNTDGDGFVVALLNEASFDPETRSFLLLGAGGAARAIAFTLLESGAGSVAIANRTQARATSLAEELSMHFPNRAGAVPFPASDVASYDCIVNTTSVGMHGGGAEAQSPCDFSTATPGALAVDIVYIPAETPFLRAAAAHGLPTLGGLPMLIYQGAAAFVLWTNHRAPVGVMFDAARAELARRESIANERA